MKASSVKNGMKTIILSHARRSLKLVTRHLNVIHVVAASIVTVMQ